MNWIELSVATDAEGAEAAAALLNEFVSGGAVIEETLLPDASSRGEGGSDADVNFPCDDASSDAGETIDPARAFTVRAFFSPDHRAGVERAEQALWHLAQLRSMGKPRTRELAEEDWAEAWKKHYTILHIGKSLVIKPSWLEYAPQPDEIIIELDPGMAFGTGLHPTTRLCMVALEERVRPGMRMIDVGTGSGILSITAAKLGGRDILALDLDAVAVDTAARNVAINHAESIVRVERGTITGEHRNLFDFVCINILAEVICELSPAVSAALRPSGIVIASGILDFKVDTVIDALREVGIQTVEKKQEEDWVALVGKKSQVVGWFV